MIQLGLEQRCTLRAIACSVQRSPSTVTRELARNGWTCPAVRPRKRGRPPVPGGYGGVACRSLKSQTSRTTQRQHSGCLALQT